MDMTCSHCSKTLRIPDEKVPKGQIVRITCPACKNKITIDTRSKDEGEHAPSKANTTEEAEVTSEELDYGDDTSLGFYEEGTKLVLVLDSDPVRREQARTAVEAMEYRFVDTAATRDAISKLRFHIFDLVILAEGFDGQSLENSPIINFLNHLPMSVRRKTFLALLGDRFQTTDNMMAFAMSANLVINPGDLNKLSVILRKALADNERFYKVFMDTLRETGRA